MCSRMYRSWIKYLALTNQLTNRSTLVEILTSYKSSNNHLI